MSPEEFNQLRGEVARLRAAVLLIARHHTRHEGLAEVITPESVEALNGLVDMLKEDEIFFQENLFDGLKTAVIDEPYRDLLDGMTEEEQIEYLDSADPLHTPDLASQVFNLSDTALQEIARTHVEHEMATPNSTGFASVGVVQSTAQDVIEEVTLANLEESVQKLIDGFINEKFTPSIIMQIQAAVFGYLTKVSYSIDVSQDFWYVDVVPDMDAQSVCVRIMPKVLRGRDCGVAEVSPDRWKAWILLPDKGANEAVELFAPTSMEALVGIARIIEVRETFLRGSV